MTSKHIMVHYPLTLPEQATNTEPYDTNTYTQMMVKFKQTLLEA